MFPEAWYFSTEWFTLLKRAGVFHKDDMDLGEDKDTDSKDLVTE